MATRYRHDPLALDKQQIRLLQIDFTAGPAIHAALRIFDLDNGLPPYQALSYTWGPEDPKQYIQINGHDRLYVRQNLYDFLEIFIQKTEIQSQYIWIDQTCIDQTSPREKNHQVSMISDIFSKADRVLMWLGNHSEGEKFANMCQSLKVIEAQISPSKRDLNDHEQRVLDRLLNVQYWKRLWVVQEVIPAKARIIVYGKDLLEWDLFMKVEFITSYLSPVDFIGRLMIYEHAGAHGVLGANALRKLRMARLICLPKHCSDPRDQVYGLQSVLPLGVRIPVDYRKSVHAVFLEAITQHIIYVFSSGTEIPIEILAFSMGLIESQDQVTGGLEHLKPYSTWLWETERGSQKLTAGTKGWDDLGRQAKHELRKMMEHIKMHITFMPLIFESHTRDWAIQSVAIVWADRVRTGSISDDHTQHDNLFEAQVM